MQTLFNRLQLMIVKKAPHKLDVTVAWYRDLLEACNVKKPL